jgi:D-hydroxyproline dehydrogenase subunit beta
VKPDCLLGGLWSPTETCVDPREVIAGLPAYLREVLGVEFVFDCAVKACDCPQVLAGRRKWHADRLWVCTGDDLQTLYPEVYERSGLVRCKLQMMRSGPFEGRRMGPMLAAGLTLRHYPSFADCPSLPAVQERIAREMPVYDRYGIHVMAAQNGKGEVIIGDSHEYQEAIEPFDKSQIEELILSYLNTFLEVPGLQIAAHWHGTYVKHPAEPYFVARPSAGVTVVTGLGGAGMTLSFGLAEQVIKESLGES